MQGKCHQLLINFKL